MKKLDLQDIINEIKHRNLTAYEISKDLPISEVGINKILNGQSKNPRESTLILLRNYLFKEKEIENKENPPTYGIEDIVAKRVIDLMDDRWKNSEKYNEIIVLRLAKQTEKMELMQIYLERMRQTLEQFEKTLIKEAIEIRKNLK